MFGALFLMEKGGIHSLICTLLTGCPVKRVHIIRMAGSSEDFVKVHKNIINILLNIPDRQHIFFLILLHAVIK